MKKVFESSISFQGKTEVFLFVLIQLSLHWRYYILLFQTKTFCTTISKCFILLNYHFPPPPICEIKCLVCFPFCREEPPLWVPSHRDQPNHEGGGEGEERHDGVRRRGGAKVSYTYFWLKYFFLKNDIRLKLRMAKLYMFLLYICVRFHFQ